MIVIYAVCLVCLAVGYLAGRWGSAYERDVMRDVVEVRQGGPIKRHVIDRILYRWAETPTSDEEWELVRDVYYMRDPYPTGPGIAAFVTGLRNRGEDT